MIVTVTPNPAVDSTYAVRHLRLGESHRVEDVSERAGGKGVNVASVLAGMGRQAVAVAPVGTDVAGWFAADLDHRGVGRRLVETHCRSRRSVAVVDDTGQATLLNEAGAVQPDAVWTSLLETVRALTADASVVVVSGSLPPAAPPDLVRQLAALARRSGAQVLLDVGGPALVCALAARPDLVKPNRSEAESAVGAGPGVDRVVDLLTALRRRGARAAMVSDGANGVHLLHEEVAVRAWLPTPLRGNATGAGDALTAALAADLEDLGGLPGDGETWAPVLRRAVAWSAAAVRQPVAGVVDPDDVARLLPDVRVTAVNP